MWNWTLWKATGGFSKTVFSPVRPAADRPIDRCADRWILPDLGRSAPSHSKQWKRSPNRLHPEPMDWYGVICEALRRSPGPCKRHSDFSGQCTKTLTTKRYRLIGYRCCCGPKGRREAGLRGDIWGLFIRMCFVSEALVDGCVAHVQCLCTYRSWCFLICCNINVQMCVIVAWSWFCFKITVVWM